MIISLSMDVVSDFNDDIAVMNKFFQSVFF